MWIKRAFCFITRLIDRIDFKPFIQFWLRYWWCILFIVFFYVVFGYHAIYNRPVNGDESMYLAIAKEHGIKSLWHLHLTCYYPLVQLSAYLFGWWGFRIVAFSAILLLGYYSIRFHGRIVGTVLTTGVIYLLGNFRYESAASTGIAAQFAYLIVALLFLTTTVMRKRDVIVLTFLSFISGLSGLVAPFYLLRFKNKNYVLAAILTGAILLVHIGIKNYMPTDTPSDYSPLLSRKVSFDPIIWLAALNVKSISSIFGDTNTIKQVSTVAIQMANMNGKTLFVFGMTGFGWMILLFGAGWRYAIAVLICSMMCFAFSAPNIKWHMVIYPDHAHYLHWVTGCLWIGLILGFNQHNKYMGKQ